MSYFQHFIYFHVLFQMKYWVYEIFQIIAFVLYLHFSQLPKILEVELQLFRDEIKGKLNYKRIRHQNYTINLVDCSKLHEKCYLKHKKSRIWSILYFFTAYQLLPTATLIKYSPLFFWFDFIFQVWKCVKETSFRFLEQLGFLVINTRENTYIYYMYVFVCVC